MKRSLTSMLAVLVVASCAGPLDVSPDDLRFTADQIRPGSELPVPDPIATGGEGEIQFQGAVDTPVPCYEVDGRVTTAGDRISLRVGATPLEGVCIQVLATFGYEGTLGGVPVGTYPVEIVHVVDGRTEEVFEGEVDVE